MIFLCQKLSIEFNIIFPFCSIVLFLPSALQKCFEKEIKFNNFIISIIIIIFFFFFFFSPPAP
ncbi:hypothetical protein PP707_05230 [Acetobacter pasteurianus]|nr:hypothetical protein [Acetobacter pasteurianus]